MSLYPITVNTEAEAPAHIYAEDDAAIYQSIFGNDCVFDIGSKLKATVLSNNKVRVADGVLCVGGHVARNKYGDYQDMTILNGTAGKNRNDLIVARFSTTGAGGIDDYTLEVKQGTAGTTATDPAVTQGNLYQGAVLREFPLYRVKLEGLSIVKVEQLFAVRKTNEQLQNEVDELNSKLPKMQTGRNDIGNVAGGTSSTLKITFPEAFSETPRVVATPYVVSSSPGAFEIAVTAINANNFTVRITNRAGGSYWASVDWIAIVV